MSLAIREIIDISLELDDSKFSMRTPPGFKRDLQFQLEVLKEHDAAEGAGQSVRGVHMRLHAGSHIEAPEHNVRGGRQVQDLPLETFAGDAVVADLRHLVPGQAITAAELEGTVGAVMRRGDRLLLRTDVNKTYMSDDWMKRAPYLRSDATRWCIDKGVVLVGYDFYHGVVDYEYTTWYGILALAKTPAAILQSLNTAISEFGTDLDLKGKIIAQGIEPHAVALRDFDLQIRRDTDRLAPLLKSLPEHLDN